MSRPVTPFAPTAIGDWTNQLGGDMTNPLPPSDADRIIAAQAEQGHKTRVLLVWLLLGIPAAVGLVWVIVIGVSAAGGTSQPSDFTGTVVQTAAPLSIITDSTPCAAVNAGVADFAMDGYAGYPTDSIRGTFQNECQDHPDWVAGKALTKAREDFVAPTN